MLTVSVMGVSLEGKEIGQLFLLITTAIVCHKTLIDKLLEALLLFFLVKAVICYQFVSLFFSSSCLQNKQTEKPIFIIEIPHESQSLF